MHGDLGRPLRHGQPALPLIAERLPATFELTVDGDDRRDRGGDPARRAGATHRGGPLDLLAMGVALLGQAVPNFWLAIMAILLFAVTLGWLPTSGRGTWQNVVMPAGVLAIGLMALLTRLARSTMLDVLSEDYVRTARAKGLRDWAVLSQHALRNALIPLVTVVGLQFGYILGGAVVIETVFTWPGVGPVHHPGDQQPRLPGRSGVRADPVDGRRADQPGWSICSTACSTHASGCAPEMSLATATRATPEGRLSRLVRRSPARLPVDSDTAR